MTIEEQVKKAKEILQKYLDVDNTPMTGNEWIIDAMIEFSQFKEGIKEVSEEEEISIEQWCENVIKGSGGFKSMEDREIPFFGKKGRDVAIAEFVVRAIANKNCKGSQELIKIIYDRLFNHEQKADT